VMVTGVRIVDEGQGNVSDGRRRSMELMLDI
jgi:hypothetical protein